MPESDPADRKIQTGSGRDYLVLASKKAGIYSQSLLRNPAGLHDPGVCSLVYGAFQGSEGDYVFHQQLAMEKIVADNPVITVDYPQPDTPIDHAKWFLESVLNGDAGSARNAVFFSLDNVFPPGDVITAISNLAAQRKLSPDSVHSVCTVWGSLREYARYRLPYLPSGDQARPRLLFVSWTKLEAETNRENIRLGDQLPDHYQRSLEKLKDIAPETFQAQAKQLAYFFRSLDEGKELLDQNGHSLRLEVNAAADEISQLPSILAVYSHHQMAQEQAENAGRHTSPCPGVVGFTPFKSVSPEKALPHWIRSRVAGQTEKISGPGIPQSVRFYEQ